MKDGKLGKLMPFGIFAMLLLIMIPVPPLVLDILLLINIAISAVIFLVSLQAKNVLEFSVLPTVLIFTTLTRIVLNVSSSRLILAKATGGKVIDAIGEITIGGDYAVGIIIFIIITMIMFLVVNKGTERVSEVSARFILDGMPGKQMSIDSDLNSGAITLEEAQTRRENLEQESDFYKSMDGASKFVKGDAIAGLIITVVNVVGGLVMGIVRHDMVLSEAASTYTILSIGDGLVNQLPSLLIASAAAFMVTRGNTKDGMDKDMIKQFLQYKEPLLGLAIIMGGLGILSISGVMGGVPWIVCFTIAGISFALSRVDLDSSENKKQESIMEVDDIEYIEEKAKNLFVDKIIVYVGSNVANAIVERVRGENKISEKLKHKIDVLKERICKKYGVKIPNIRITDDEYISANAFTIRIANQPSVSLNVKPGCSFAAFFSDNTEIEFGEKANIPYLGLDGYWISKSDIDKAEDMGAITYTIHDILIMYIESNLENNLEKLISREDIKLFKEEVQEYNTAIVEEIALKQVENSIIQRVVQNLLMEKIPIKNFEFILECIADAYTEITRLSADSVTAFVREKIAPIITEDKIENGVLNCILFGEEAHNILIQKMQGQMDEQIHMDCSNIYLNIASTYKRYSHMGQKVVFVCDSSYRKDVFQSIADFGIKIDIISFEELPKTVRIETIKTIERGEV